MFSSMLGIPKEKQIFLLLLHPLLPPLLPPPSFISLLPYKATTYSSGYSGTHYVIQGSSNLK